MSSTVNIGTLQGVLGMRDAFTAHMDKFEARLKAVEEKAAKTSRTTKTETDKISTAYQKVAAALDPVVANSQKYEKAADSLGAALKAGVINQDRHNALLAQAKEKYLSASASTHTWREEISHLTEKISGLSSALGPFGKEAAESFEHASTKALSLSSVLSGLVSSGPALMAFAGAVVALGVAFAELEIIKETIEFISDAVEEGLKLQLVIDRLNKALIINGSASGLSAKEMVELAEGYELVTTRSKEEIVAAETVLSRFDHLGKEAFPRALNASLAFAKATGETADAVAKRLGPALEGNAKSLASLKEIGIVFTAGQKKMLTQMVETGNVIGYQEKLFDILEQKIGKVGDTIDNNLTRQFKRAKIVGDEFKEGIASEVIPALEDLVSTLVDSLGGWETIKRVVTAVGHDIGNQVRQLVYGVAISYHEWLANHNILVANVTDGFRKILSAISSFAHGMASLPLPGANIWQSAAEGVDKAVANLTATVQQHRKSATEHAQAIINLSKKYKEHRLALEGDAAVHPKLASAMDEVANATKRQKNAFNKVDESIAAMQLKVKNLISAYLAATMGVKAYNAEVLRQKVEAVILAEENKLRETGKHLTQDQRNAIAAVVIEENNLTNATKLTLQAWDKLAKLAESVSIFEVSASVKEIGKEIASIQASMAVRGRELTEQYLSDEDKKAKAVKEALELLKNGNISQQTYDKIKLDNAIQWTTEITRAYDQFVKIQEKLSVIADDLAGALTNTLINGLREGKLEVRAIGDAVRDVFLNTLGDIINAWLSAWFKAFGSWLARWIATQKTGQIASASLQGSTQSGGNLGSSVVTYASRYAGYAAAAYALYVVYKGFIEDHKRKFGSITIVDGASASASGHGAKLIKQVQEAASELLKNLFELTKQLSLEIAHYGTVILEASKAGFNVTFSPTSTGKLFKTMQEAQEYAQVLMLKYAEFSDSISFLVQSVIKSTKAINIEQLTSDIDFARVLDSQNLESVAADMKSALDLAMSQWLRAKELWAGIFDTNLPAFAEAAASIITKLTTSLASQYNSLMGIKEDPKAAWQRQALAYNAQRAIILAQIKLWELEIQARIANYNATRTLIGGGGGGGGGKGGGGGYGYVGVTGQFTKFVAAFVQASTDTIDAGMQALLDIQKLLQDAEGSIPGVIDPTKYPGTKGGKGGGRVGQKDSVRDWISEKRYDLDTRSLDEWGKKVADISRQYEDQIKQAGKDKSLKASLIALKERELQLLSQEEMNAVRSTYRDFIGDSNAFTQVKETASKLIKSIEDSPLGDTEKASMVAGALAKVNAQIEELSLQSASSLFGSLIGDLEKYGADEKEMAGYRQQLAIIEHTLKVAHYRAEFAILQASGSLSKEILAMLGKAIDKVAGFDPSKVVIPSSPSRTMTREKFSNSVESVTSELDRLRESFKSAKEKILETVNAFDRGQYGAVTPEASWQAASKQFEDTISSARAGSLESLQAAPEAFTTALDVLKNFSPALYASESFKLRDKLASLGDVSTIREGNLIITDFERRAQHKETLGALSSIANVSQEQTNIQAQMLDRLEQLNTSQTQLNSRLARVEALNLGNKR